MTSSRCDRSRTRADAPHSYHKQPGWQVGFLALRSAGHYMLQRGWGGRQCGHPPRACRGAHAQAHQTTNPEGQVLGAWFRSRSSQHVGITVAGNRQVRCKGEGTRSGPPSSLVVRSRSRSHRRHRNKRVGPAAAGRCELERKKLGRGEAWGRERAWGNRVMPLGHPMNGPKPAI